MTADCLLNPRNYTEIRFYFAISITIKMFDPATDLAIEQIAMESNSTVDDIMNELAEIARCLQESARCRGITLSDAVNETLSRNKQMSLTAGKRGA